MADGSEAIVVLLRDDVELRTWPLDLGQRADLRVVDVLAHRRLCALRAGCTIRIRNCPDDLRHLLHLVGLSLLLDD